MLDPLNLLPQTSAGASFPTEELILSKLYQSYKRLIDVHIPRRQSFLNGLVAIDEL